MKYLLVTQTNYHYNSHQVNISGGGGLPCKAHNSKFGIIFECNWHFGMWLAYQYII